ncbi:MAG: hypothetical protein Kow00128_23740 [Deltaproteobacteria bacterium]
MRSVRVVSAVVLLAGVLGWAGCAGHSPAAALDLRAERIAIQIERAEQMGARECAPKELARAKVLLDHIRHEMIEGHYPSAWAARDLNVAEKVANAMLQGRILAQRSGFECYHPGS